MAPESQLSVLVEGFEPEDQSLIQAVVVKAANALSMENAFSAIEIIADTILYGEPWYSISDSGTVKLWIHPDSFSEQKQVEKPDWALAELVHDAGAITINPIVLNRFIFHHLLILRDIVNKDIIVSNRLPTSFFECWAVTVDSRLHQQGLPGFPAADCRKRFYRYFSQKGVLLPHHWEIFRSLWEAEQLSQDDLISVAKQLPVV